VHRLTGVTELPYMLLLVTLNCLEPPEDLQGERPVAASTLRLAQLLLERQMAAFVFLAGPAMTRVVSVRHRFGIKPLAS